MVGKNDFHVLVDRGSPVGLRIEVGNLSILPHLHSSSNLCLEKVKKALEKIFSYEGLEKGPSEEVLISAREALTEIEKAISRRSN